jgi:7-carboxy-7-deazaguanine synthase
MQVNEIFQSIEGEGIRAGSLATFIRLRGCNLNCSYCDSKYANEPGEFNRELSAPEILQLVEDISIGNLVTITGGEPLIHLGVYDLIILLINAGYEVNVETNGSMQPQLSSTPGQLFYTMDYKCPSSGEEHAMNWVALGQLKEWDVLKFVVGSLKDLEKARFVIDNLTPACPVFISPVFGQIEPVQIVEYMQEQLMFPCRIQLQLHKFIWDPQKRGV